MNVWLTTVNGPNSVENPWNPFTHFREWNAFDVAHGYNTCQYIASVALTAPELSDDDVEDILEEEIDRACRLNLRATYKKVYRNES